MLQEPGICICNKCYTFATLPVKENVIQITYNYNCTSVLQHKGLFPSWMGHPPINLKLKVLAVILHATIYKDLYFWHLLHGHDAQLQFNKNHKGIFPTHDIGPPLHLTSDTGYRNPRAILC